MAADNERDVVVGRRVERTESAANGLASVAIVLGVIAAIAVGWWVVGTTPVRDDNRMSEGPTAGSANTTVAPRTTTPEGSSGKAL